jgi:hypothetical protein
MPGWYPSKLTIVWQIVIFILENCESYSILFFSLCFLSDLVDPVPWIHSTVLFLCLRFILIGGGCSSFIVVWCTVVVLVNPVLIIRQFSSRTMRTRLRILLCSFRDVKL